MLSFSTSNFSLGVGKKKRKKSAAIFKSVDFKFDALFYRLLLRATGSQEPRTRQSLGKVKMNAHSMAVVSVYTNIVRWRLLDAVRYMILLSCYFTVIVIQSLPAIL